MKKKRKNNINKYNLGGMPQLIPFNQTSAYQQLNVPMQNPISSGQQLQSPVQQMGANAGGGGLSNIAEGVGQLAGMVTGPSTATTKGEAVQQSIQNVIGGTATGAKMGAAFGPVGAIVGGAVGLAAGLTGKKGKVTASENYYEDPTMTLGTGIRGAIGNRKLRRKNEELKTLAAQHRIGATTGAFAQQKFLEDYDQDIQTMSYGGQIPTNLAYVDDGEVISTPEGDILHVPEEGKPTDSNLVELPVGSKILSDKLKVPGTKKTFAQMGKKMMSKKKTKGNDVYAQNSAKLNQMNDQIIHDKLFEMQESIKVNKKTKNGIQAAANGDIITRSGRIGDETIPYNDVINTTNNTVSDTKTTPIRNGYDWKGLLGDIASNISRLSPIFSNLMTRPESFDAVHNPYANPIMYTMAGRKFDISPAQRAIRENRAVSNYNAAQYNPTTGANLAYRLQSQIAANKAISDLYSQKSNIDNQYKGDYANTLNNLGQQFVSARNLAIDQNARSRAAAGNINRTELSQLSNYAQNKELMRNQRNRDIAMLDAYAPFLESVYKSGDYSNLMKQFRKG